MYSFCLASLIQYNYFESHPFLCVCISVLHFLAQQYSIMWIKHSLFIHSPVYDCFGFFPGLGYYEQSCSEHSCTVFVWTCAFTSFGKILKC